MFEYLRSLFDKSRYPLPAFPPNAIPTFRKLSKVLSEEEVLELSGHLLQIEEEYLSSKETRKIQQLPLVRGMVRASNEMLKEYFNFPPAHQKLIAGAVRYFVDDVEDPLSENILITGFSDDVQIINHVLEKLGFEGLFIDDHLN